MTSAMRAHREAEDGFTLIELLVVVIIIGILAAIAIPAFLNQRERAWQSELTSAVRNSALEIEAEATQNGGAYPTEAAGSTAVYNFVDANISSALTSGTNASHADATGDSPIFLIDYNPVATDGTTVVTGATTGAGFSLCMQHDLINDTANSVTYLGGNAGSGVQPFREATCTDSADHLE